MLLTVRFPDSPTETDTDSQWSLPPDFDHNSESYLYRSQNFLPEFLWKVQRYDLLLNHTAPDALPMVYFWSVDKTP